MYWESANQKLADIPESLTADEPFVEVFSDFQIHQMNVNSVVETSMNVFFCAAHKDTEYHLTYGFREQHFFVLSVPRSNLDDRTNVKFYALLQPNVKVDVILTRKQNYLAHLFWGHYLFEGFNPHTNGERK